MEQSTLLPNLFRTEYRKMVAVLCALFGMEHIETAEDIVSDTFLTATETWSYGSIPENPVAWLYTVAKNKARNHLNRTRLFEQKLAPQIRYQAQLATEEITIDLSQQHISDSQLAMIFAVCDPVVPADAQVALALNLLCGFGIQEIATAFFTGKDVIYKRLSRAKQKLKEHNLQIGQPGPGAIKERLLMVIRTIYLVFSEGYYSISHDRVLRKDLCDEAMRLASLLLDNKATDLPAVNALMALMCFHASRFEARNSHTEEMILYKDQDRSLWDNSLIEKGIYYLNRSSEGPVATRYHLEAGIAYWHTLKEELPEKWENILQLYNKLLIIEYSPVAALNRTYALAMARGKEAAIPEAAKLGLTDNHFYFSLLGNLYTGVDKDKARQYYSKALELAGNATDRQTITKYLDAL